MTKAQGSVQFEKNHTRGVPENAGPRGRYKTTMDRWCRRCGGRSRRTFSVNRPVPGRAAVRMLRNRLLTPELSIRSIPALLSRFQKNTGTEDLARVLLELARIFHERIMDLLCDVSVLCRISLRCMEVLSSTGFSLCGVPRPGKSKPHRLKPVLLDRTRPVAACGEIGRESPQSSCEKCALERP